MDDKQIHKAEVTISVKPTFEPDENLQRLIAAMGYTRAAYTGLCCCGCPTHEEYTYCPACGVRLDV